MLLVATPGIVGCRAGMPHEARRLLELGLGHPARRFGSRRWVLTTERGKLREDRPAEDVALHCLDLVLAVDGEVGGRGFVSANPRIEPDGPVRAHVPSHIGSC